MLQLSLLRRVSRRLQIAIHRRAIEGDDDDFAAVAVVAVFLFLFHVNHRQGDGGNMAVFDVDAGAFQFVQWLTVPSV